MNLQKKDVLLKWACSGIRDFLIAFTVSDFFPFFVGFCYHQGIEKVCKAYILGKRASEYESLSEQDARNKINEIAKKIGHNLKVIIKDLIATNVLDRNALIKEYSDLHGFSIDVEKCLDILEKAYLECRYPVPIPVYKNFPITDKNGKKVGAYWDPLNSSDPMEFAYNTGLEVITGGY